MDTRHNPSALPSKVTVKIKNEDSMIREDFLIHDSYTLDYTDPILNEIVNMTASKYKGDLVDADITITSKMTWQKLPQRSD